MQHSAAQCFALLLLLHFAVLMLGKAQHFAFAHTHTLTHPYTRTGMRQSFAQCFALLLLVCGAALLSGEAKTMQKEGVENRFWEGIVPVLTASLLSGKSQLEYPKCAQLIESGQMVMVCVRVCAYVRLCLLYVCIYTYIYTYIGM
jgi:hypothetical protein